MADPIPGNGEPQPELESSPLEYILDLKARGDLSRPPIKYIKEAQEHLHNREALKIL